MERIFLLSLDADASDHAWITEVLLREEEDEEEDEEDEDEREDEEDDESEDGDDEDGYSE